jgi:CRP-like cAMP-binding protein
MEEARLRAIPLFAELGRREIEALSRCTDEVDVAEGKELVHEGDFGYEFFVIEDGRAEVRHEGETLAELGPGDFFGELALSGSARRSASVVAATSLTAIVMTRSAYRQMRHDIPAVCDRIEAVVDDRGRELAEP